MINPCLAPNIKAPGPDLTVAPTPVESMNRERAKEIGCSWSKSCCYSQFLQSVRLFQHLTRGTWPQQFKCCQTVQHSFTSLFHSSTTHSFAMNTITALQFYIDKMLVDTPGMKVLLLDQETVNRNRTRPRSPAQARIGRS